MLILNHPSIESLNLVFITNKEQIADTLPTDFLILSCGDFSQTLALARFCKENGIPYASQVSSLKEALLLVNLNVRFLLSCTIPLAQNLQKLAETYLFDAKILLCIQEEERIEEVAQYGIDGVIFVA
ncbi:hypothetical protein [Helicobacter sp. MIT 05-5294]|uniref:hypothetical protein n=1 Tax=Helicobacter sp. MIT 05-5294 TaxID=1548150 RepID=UPI00051FB9AF|nr:hypothetical protein [Helicobacter sp. MIT 05-5294]TLD87855.1 hypothetical protein LS69_003445 [Helicobacter sp. MIT 05-5294]